MRRLDTYVLRQIFFPFVFFVVVFTGIIWLTQSLRVIDTVINNGQSARVFLEFTVLLLPLVMSIVLPISVFAAVLYAVNRLFGDSEITVMFASGMSGPALLRPVVIFSVAATAAMAFNTIFLMPSAQREMRGRITEIRADVAAAFLREGEFQTPSSGVTVYMREMGRSGEMFGIFVHDARKPDQIVTYTAEKAYLLRSEQETRLVMFNGVAQSITGPLDENLSLLRFDQISYDLTQFAGSEQVRARKPSELFLPRLLSITEQEARPRSIGEFRAEAHEALSAPLYALALPMLAVALVVGAGFRRQGFAGRIVIAVIAAVALRLTGFAAKSATTSEPELAVLMYLPPVAAVVFSVWYLARGGRTRTGRRRPPLLDDAEPEARAT